MEGEQKVVGGCHTEKGNGGMNLTDTVGLVKELELEEGLEERAEGCVGGNSSGNLEEEVEVAAVRRMLRDD